MSRKIDKHVAKAIVEIAVFLEFSGQEAINSDSSILMLEQLAATLQMADSAAKSCLCSTFKEISNEYANDQAVFVENLAETLGLVDE